MDTESLDMLSTYWWEVSHPMISINEFRDLLLGEAQLSHDVVLVLLLRIYRLRRKLRWVTIGFQF